MAVIETQVSKNEVMDAFDTHGGYCQANGRVHTFLDYEHVGRDGIRRCPHCQNEIDIYRYERLRGLENFICDGSWMDDEEFKSATSMMMTISQHKYLAFLNKQLGKCVDLQREHTYVDFDMSDGERVCKWCGLKHDTYKWEWARAVENLVSRGPWVEDGNLTSDMDVSRRPDPKQQIQDDLGMF